MKKIIYFLAAFVLAVPATSQIKMDRYVPPPGMPKSIIIIIADGAGLGQLSAGMGSKSAMNLERFKNIGLLKPSSVSPTDMRSAIATMFSGTNTSNAKAGSNTEGNPTKNLADFARERQMDLALITTSSVTSAIPVAFFTHAGSQKNHEALAQEIAKASPTLIIGGGSKYFNERSDKINLLQDFFKNGYAVEDKEKKATKIRKLKTIALVSKEDMYAATNRNGFLPDAVSNSTRLLSGSRFGYLLLVTTSYVSKAAESKSVEILVNEVQDLDIIIGDLLKNYGNDNQTLIIVTGVMDAGGASVNRLAEGKEAANINWAGNTYNNNMVPVFANGPGAETFTGIYDYQGFFARLKPLIINRK